MGLFSKSSESAREYKQAKREHNDRFNDRNTDPDDPEYLESANKVGDAARNVGWLRRG
ncbi:hypothetical protein ABZT43_12305 [Streptomyces sp. NPDC005349]|uniref:hypothetical protein n=1 Tax=Streptomyces sp. NPDC005349 TaxID=3157037 RepID=UPI0033A07316